MWSRLLRQIDVAHVAERPDTKPAVQMYGWTLVCRREDEEGETISEQHYRKS